MYVSIIIPAYNAAKTIADTLNSLLAQTSAHWEAVVVNDGSSDATAAIVSDFAARDARFRLYTQPNAGEAGARNVGIGLARYDWLLFLDADDWIAPHYLERMTTELQTNPHLDAVHCGYARVAADGTQVVENYQPPTGDMFPVLARRAAFPVHACIVRKALVEEVGRFDPSLRTSPDWDLWQRIARIGAYFGAVREVLAFYRMTPSSASLNAYQLFTDDLRVLRQGHAPDARVRNPKPEHENGAPPEQVQTQEFYLLAWCGGLLLGARQDARPLLEMVGEDHFPELYPEAIAQCIFEAATLPSCQPPQFWEKLWPEIQQNIEDFLDALEQRSQAPDLAQQASVALKVMILKHSPSWSTVIGNLQQHHAVLEEDCRQWRRVAEEHSRFIHEQQNMMTEFQQTRTDLEKDQHTWQYFITESEQFATEQQGRITRLEQARSQLEAQLQQRLAEQNALVYSYEQRLGDLLLNRFRLRASLLATEQAVISMHQCLTRARLGMERRLPTAQGKRHRMITTICDTFPIYSQTFVYQELTQLAQQGFDIRLVYSTLAARDYLSKNFEYLWQVKRRLWPSRRIHEQDFARYRARMPEKIDALVDQLCCASGLSQQALLSHDNFLQAFSFVRMVEAYRPEYLHSYFFYNCSLMSLIAGYLLNIPRGISCYADHLLKDYELKVVPLHLQLCDIVVATSQRIKQELLDIAPQTDPSRIIVKPNGIDTTVFPILQRADPMEGAPFRLVSVCRIEPKKGLIDFVEALGLLRQRGMNVEAHIVGTVDEWSEASRSYKQQLDQRISELDLWGKVHLEGRQNLEGVQRFLGLAHLFVASFVETDTGDKDGIPTALLEAMATGLPAVATDAGSISEVISNGQNGVLVPQRNPAALADAIGTLLRYPDRRVQFGKAAAETVRHHYNVQSCEQVFHERVRAVALMKQR